MSNQTLTTTLQTLPFILALSACGVQPQQDSKLDRAWNRANNPNQMDYVYLTQVRDYVTKFDKLPLNGALKTTPWSDNYSPTYLGGISYRWNQSSTDELDRYAYEIKYQDTELKSLSPAEKYDIYIGAKHMPLTNYERDRTNIMKTVSTSDLFDPTYKIPGWEGLCHAWAPATMMFKEPQPVVLEGKNGVQVPFGSSDVKALLTYFLHLYTNNSDTQFLGSRCEVDFSKLEEQVQTGEITRAEMNDIMDNSQCGDTNAGAFHVVIANQLARLNEGFVIDVTRDAEVWNQPVYKYSSKVVAKHLKPGPKAAKGTVEEVEIETRLHYIVEVGESYFPANRGSEESRMYRYRLELNKKGEIIGGEWLESKQRNDRPDFMWKQATPEFKGTFFDELETIYKASIAE